MKVALVSPKGGVGKTTLTTSIVAIGRDMYRPDQLPRIAHGFDHVVIDTAGELGDFPAAALMVAHVALVPISPSGIDVWGNP